MRSPSYFAALLQTLYYYYSKLHVVGFLQHFELERPSGHLQFYHGPGAGHLHTPGRPPGFDTHVFESAMEEFICKDEAFVEDWLVHQGLNKLVDVFKRIFSQFKIFLHYL